jgi:glycosyltransferase involved in cell wall biosynthesis
LRFALRRLLAIRKREKNKDTWPIDPAAGRVPASWPGWPDGKRFAFVLTHDVEGLEGLAKCQQLAELEMSLGFRSSFNFIPEGDYTVSAGLRAWLTENGFEVGVHDLHHDGKLYSSRQGFLEKARRINGYVKEWGAAGYRSGFMLHNLEWHHDIDVEYDASTFDTDPFEPQPDGVGTIFPFWVPRPSLDGASGTLPGPEALIRDGYVELPYTLAQDSTLFLLFREKTAETWLRKMHWVAGQGGMALANIHPDYLRFAGEKRSPDTFPVELYTALLQEVASRHAGQYWNPTPRKLARWYQETVHPAVASAPGATATAGDHAFAGLRGKRVAVLLYSVYPGDPRPRRAAEALAECGMEVDVLCQRHQVDAPAQERVNGVEVWRLPISRRRDNKFTYLWQYSRFFFSSFWFLTWRSLRQKYDLIHVHNMPDFLAFAALIPKLRGAKVILDLHDPMPELMTTIFGGNENSTGVRLLKAVEKWSTGFANAVITVNEACRRIFSNRSCPAEKITVIMNSPDEQIFASRTPDARVRAPGAPFVIMYHGSLVERHGLDLAVTALGTIRQFAPEAELRVYGSSTPYLQKVMKLVEESGLSGAVHYHGSHDLEEIAEAIRESDVGIIPNRRSIFTEINTPTRIFEYLSQGRPVIAPRAPGILDYFGPDDLVYFELGSAEDLARKIEFVYREPAAVRAIVEHGQAVYRNHRWHRERERFLHLVSTLLGLKERPAAMKPTANLAPIQGGP